MSTMDSTETSFISNWTITEIEMFRPTQVQSSPLYPLRHSTGPTTVSPVASSFSYDNFSDSTDFLEEEESFLLSIEVELLLLFFVIVIGIVMVVGNLLIFTATLRHQRLRTYNGLLIANLSLADFGVGCFIMPLVAISIFNQKWIFSQTLCNFFGSLVDLFCIASMLNLLCIAIDRYYATVYCMDYNKKMNKKKLVAFIFWIWFQPLAIAMAPFSGWSRYIYISNEFVCTADWALSLSYTIIACTVSIPIPLVAVIYLYIRIFRAVWKMKQNMKRMCGENFNLQKRNNGLKKTAKVSIIVVGSFLICWTPHFVTMLYLAFKSYFGVTANEEWPDWVFTFSTLIGIGNSACNPIIYGITVPKYRQAMISLICFWSREKRNKLSNSSSFQSQKFIVF